jgi:hypothetical protein
MTTLRSRIGQIIGTLAAIVAGHTVVGYVPGAHEPDSPSPERGGGLAIGF